MKEPKTCWEVIVNHLNRKSPRPIKLKELDKTKVVKNWNHIDTSVPQYDCE